MLLKLALAAALSTGSFVGLASPAAAQSWGGITLSFGSGGYGSYDYDDDAYAFAPEQYDAYNSSWYAPSDYYYNPGYAWRAHERREQLEQWRREQEQRRYWQYERREHQQWQRDDDEDD